MCLVCVTVVDKMPAASNTTDSPSNRNHITKMIETIHHAPVMTEVSRDEKENATDGSLHSNNNSPRNDSKTASSSTSKLQWFFFDLPLATVFFVCLSFLLTQHVYHTLVLPIVDSYRRGDMDDFYPELENDFTYYNRLCDASDITTTDSSDLIVHNGKQAADTMLKHGSILFKNVVNNETTTALRAYLDFVNHKLERNALGFNENFFDEEDRLALGLGIHDHPAIAQALQQIGTHPVVKESLEAILGPDPAVLEISTMTSMHGAPDQGIHSDSDWFGSSLLYGRNFLHSYSMFVALQDTTSQMGATTVCPGSHHCANQDLEDVCLDNGAFEVSSNGHTGENGALLTGDAMLFAQDGWHRGAANQDPNTDRIMFIVTYASRTKQTPSDYRQQALGTYYYQRWNMWGHTYQDLKTAATTMALPFGALRGLGLWKWPNANWGITWIEQFSRQMANKEDFYDYDCLLDFVNVLRKWSVPEFLLANLTGNEEEDTWDRFLEESMNNVATFLCLVYAAVLGGYVLMRLLMTVISRNKNRPFAWFKRLVLTHTAVLLLVGLLYKWIQSSHLAKSVTSGHVFDKPYDYDRIDSEHGASLGPTTLPTRNDVLIGSRFDSDFLGLANRFLEVHPGNERFNDLIQGIADMPSNVQDEAVKHIVQTIEARDESTGLIGRFLLQDYTNGHWTTTTHEDAIEYTKKQIKMLSSRLHKGLGKHLASVLAESRFGANRATAMSRKFAPKFVNQWESIVFAKKEKELGSKYCRVPVDEPYNVFFDYFQIVPTVTTPSSLLAALPMRAATYSGLPIPEEHDFDVGHFVLANYGNFGRWMPAKIEGFTEDGDYLLQYESGTGAVEGTEDQLRVFDSFVAGDEVNVEVGGLTDRWLAAVVTDCHPDGTFSVEYEDGVVATGIKNIHIRFAGLPGPAAERIQADFYTLNEQVEGNYLNEGEWFLGTITAVNYFDGAYQYDVLYDDGDEETDVDPEFLRKVRS